MTRTETRLPCPACLAVKMQKVRVGQGSELVLDYCDRCGGIWFEAGEVQLLRGRRPAALWARLPQRDDVSPARCHSCHAHIDPDAVRCPACGQRVQLRCPQCDQPMERTRHADLTLDVCKRCKGVWFDHHELASIWTLERGRAMGRRKEPAVAAGSDGAGASELAGADALADALLFMPDVVFYGAHAAGHVVAGTAEALAHAPSALGEAAGSAAEAAGGVAGAIGDAAASVFEALVEIVSGIFS
ncbi:MAG TPA: zf-TFIIB domain-containing protein [Longimicrobiales bacterium]